jgi:membrane fusion protein, heavy metal efflux system
MKRLPVLFLLATSALAAGCSKDAPAPAAVHDEASANSAQALKAAGVVLQKVTRTLLNEELRASGEVVDNAYATTLITPRVEALVVRRHAKLGDEVKAGAPLVTLSSVETAEAQGDLQRAEQEWRRVQALGKDAVSGRRMDEARIGVEQARAKANAYGSNGGRANGELTLTAPHAGRLTEDDFVVGQRIEPGKTLFRLVDESTVWVDAKLPAEMDARVPIGSAAQIVAGDQRLTGKVVQRAHRTAESTRNGLVRIEVPNPDDRLHAGDYVDAFLKSDGGAVAQLAVPTTALAQLQGQTVVFRQSAEGEIEPVPVVTGAVIGDRTLISEGVAEGDTIVVTGTFVIKARLLKSQLGEGDEH